jgi:hypothetical protein
MKAKNSPLFSNEALVREISSAIANWEITMAGIQQQMESSAYAYWDSLSGRTQIHGTHIEWKASLDTILLHSFSLDG